MQATNEVVYRVPKATREEMTAAVNSCSRAFRSWSETSILARQQIFLRYQQMIKDNIVSQGIRKYKVQMKLGWILNYLTLISAKPVLWLKPETCCCIWCWCSSKYKKNKQTKNPKALTQIDTELISCFRKNSPSPLQWNRERPSRMQRGTCSEDCVSLLPSGSCTCTSLKGQQIGKCLCAIQCGSKNS